MFAKYCMFIDGVDEFNGDHFEMCHVLKELSMCPNFKIRLSSQPLNVFEDAFGLDLSQKLYIENLTRQDILNYAQDRLMDHPRSNETYFSQKLMLSVINSIIERAHGVFLWVFLVTKSLRNELINGDTIIELQRRLESLPTDLEPFFKHILDTIEPLCHQKMARILQIAVNAKEPLDLQLYQAYEYEDEDKDYALNKSIESSSKLDATLNQCRRRLNARCGGLLEIKEQRVEFLHLTVRDFVITREMSDYLRSKSGHDSSVNLSTLKAFTFLFRSWVRSKDLMSLAEDEIFWREGLKYANDALEESKEAALMHLDAVEDLYLDMSGSEDYGILDFQSGCVFQSKLLSFGVDRYVYFKLKENSHFFDGVLELPLCEISDRHHWSQGHINIIVSLLKSSHDPNIGDRDSPWGQFLQRACGKTEAHNFRKAIENGLFSVFLKHEARRVLPVSSNSEAGIDEVATVTNKRY